MGVILGKWQINGDGFLVSGLEGMRLAIFEVVENTNEFNLQHK